MKRRMSLVVVCACLLARSALAQQSPDVRSRVDLGTIRTLYASAAYEEALERLPELSDATNRDLIAVYRALCLLGLGKTEEVEQALQQLVKNSPQYMLKDDDVSPRLVDMFRDVRRRTLPSVARGLYAKAKTSYDEKHYAEVDDSLAELLMLLNDTDTATDPVVTDLKMLATEFRDLALAQLAARALATGAPDRTASTPDVAVGAPVVADTPAAIFTAADPGITPPIELARVMPPWRPSGELARRSFVGVLEIVVNERGGVETAAIRESVTPAYDAALLRAVNNWSFRPAIRDGNPVKYRAFVRIVLQARSS